MLADRLPAARYLLADKAYDADHWRAWTTVAVIFVDGVAHRNFDRDQHANARTRAYDQEAMNYSKSLIF